MATHSSVLAWRIPMNGGTWWAAVHGVAESDMIEQLSIALIYILVFDEKVKVYLLMRKKKSAHS